MKILNVNMSLDPIAGGGTAERTYQLSKALVKNGIECAVLTLDLGLTKVRLAGLDGVTLHAIPCLWKRFYIPKISLKKFKTIIQEADIIHIMGHWTLINALAYIYVKKFKKPYVFCPAGALPAFGRSKTIKQIYNFLIGNEIIKNANSYIAITAAEKSFFESIKIHADKIYIIPNGINLEDYLIEDKILFYRAFNLPQKPFVLFLGRLNHIKGPNLLLKAFIEIASSIPVVQLILAGPDDGMKAELLQSIPEHLKSRIHLIGHIAGKEKAAALACAELLVIPSRSEAMSIVVLEAGAASTPVVATDQCGLREFEEMDAVKIVKVDVEDLKNSISELLTNKEKLKSMSEI